MSEQRPPALLRCLAAALPESRRRFMFEPLCAELLQERLKARNHRSGTARFWAAIAVAFLYTFATSWPRYFRAGGRFTRFGRASIALATGLLLLVVISLAEWLTFLAQHAASD